MTTKETQGLSDMVEASNLAAHLANPETSEAEIIASVHTGEVHRQLSDREFAETYPQLRTPQEETPTEDHVKALLEVAVASSNNATADAGERARNALNAFNELRATEKSKRRKKLIRSITGWFVFFALITGIVVACWAILPKYMFAGRYTVVADCKVPFGDGEITGKRTYSYAYRSLFGYHLVDESSVLERTEVNVVGDKMIIFGLKGDKYWRQNVGMGERGIAILKPADLYFFFNDKNTAPPVKHNDFCR